MANNRDEEAEEVIQRIAHCNKVKVKGRLLQEEMLTLTPEKKSADDGDEWSRDHSPTIISSCLTVYSIPEYKKAGEENVTDLFTDPLLRRFLFIAMAIWCVMFFVHTWVNYVSWC